MTDLAELKNEFSSYKQAQEQKSSALQEHIQKQQAEALEFFKNETNKKVLLESLSQEEANQLLGDIEQGKVTRRELEVRAKLGYQKIAGPIENKTVPVAAPAKQSYNDINANFEQINAERINTIRDAAHPYNNPGDPRHGDAVKRMDALDKKREELAAQLN